MKSASIYAKCVLAIATVALGAAVVIPADAGAPNAHGEAESVHTSGAIDLTNPFFSDEFATNGRTCANCHDSSTGWTIAPDLVEELFASTDGTGTLFQPHDGAVQPNADLSTKSDREEAFRTLIRKAITRATRSISAAADFEITEVNDPHDGFSTPAAFSVFRRPNPTANLRFRPTIFWDRGPQALPDVLANVFNGATKFHGMRSTDVPLEPRGEARDFMFGLFFAQSVDNVAGLLNAAGAQGGPVHLSTLPFSIGDNDPGSSSFNPKVFDIYDAWETFAGDESGNQSRRDKARGAIFRGQQIFDFLEFDISSVAGLNGQPGIPEVITGTCSTCHNAFNAGGNTVVAFYDIGTADRSRKQSDSLVFTVRNEATGEEREVTDIGRARLTEKWDDIGKFTVPVLRGLAARPPFFHDGSAKNLKEVIQFYKQRFKMDIEGNEIDDLVAFLAAL